MREGPMNRKTISPQGSLPTSSRNHSHPTDTRYHLYTFTVTHTHGSVQKTFGRRKTRLYAKSTVVFILPENGQHQYLLLRNFCRQVNQHQHTYTSKSILKIINQL
jgi:hypothetical protein